MPSAFVAGGPSLPETGWGFCVDMAGIQGKGISPELVRLSRTACRAQREALSASMSIEDWHATLRAAMATAAEEGYCQGDVALMFGVSSSRAKQWAIRYGLTAKFRALGVGSKPRVFDWAQGRFVAQAGSVFRAERIKSRRAQRRRLKKVRRHERRILLITSLKSLAKELHRVPTTAEMVERTGHSISGVWHYFCGRKQRDHYVARDYSNALRRFYRLAGLQVREVGGRGHIV